jgi:hypothetical protein
VADEPNPAGPEKEPAAQSEPSERPTPPEKGLADLLAEAFRLYRANARPVLLICALLFVPMSFAKSCAVSALLGPRLAADAESEVVGLSRAVKASRQALDDAYLRHADAETIGRLEHEHQKRLEELSGEADQLARGGPGRFTLWVLGLLAALVSALAFAITVPLVGGALTIAVADRLDGGRAGWIESWMLLVGRVGGLLGAVVPAAGLIAIGLALWVIPGLVIAAAFALVAQVAVIEGLGGAAALRRGVELVGADWLRVALLMGLFAALTWAARWIAALIVPDRALFLTSLVGDLLTLAVMPLPLIAGALLYLDVRRRRDGFDAEQLRAVLVTLRS